MRGSDRRQPYDLAYQAVGPGLPRRRSWGTGNLSIFLFHSRRLALGCKLSLLPLGDKPAKLLAFYPTAAQSASFFRLPYVLHLKKIVI